MKLHVEKLAEFATQNIKKKGREKTLRIKSSPHSEKKLFRTLVHGIYKSIKNELQVLNSQAANLHLPLLPNDVLKDPSPHPVVGGQPLQCRPRESGLIVILFSSGIRPAEHIVRRVPQSSSVVPPQVHLRFFPKILPTEDENAETLRWVLLEGQEDNNGGSNLMRRASLAVG